MMSIIYDCDFKRMMTMSNINWWTRLQEIDINNDPDWEEITHYLWYIWEGVCVDVSLQLFTTDDDRS